MPASKLENQRKSVLHLWENGIRNAKEIHARTKIGLSTIYKMINKLKQTGNLHHAKGNGRPKKITVVVSRALGQYVRRDTTVSTRTLATKVTNNYVDVSHVTIARHLQSVGYQKSLPRATPMLTDVHKRRRIEWAHQHLNDDWSRTLFSDETAFQLFRNTIEHWHKGKKPIRPIPKDRSKIFAWGGFCVQGKTSLFCFRRIMNAQFYVEILDNHIPEINEMLGNEWRFQQDNDPKHTSHLARAFLAENMPQVMDWPSNSPDLNPIENLWSIVKKSVERRMPKNLPELERFMVEEWNNIPNHVLINLAQSMKRRCELIIEKNGEHIPY